MVGAGVLGTWLTIWAQQRGLKVYALEAGEARNLRPETFHLHQRTDWRQRLFFDGLDHWCEELGPERPPGFQARIDMQLQEGADFAALSRFLESRRHLHRCLDRGQVSRLFPGLRSGPEQCIFSEKGSVELTLEDWLAYRWTRSGAVTTLSPVVQVDLEHEIPTAVTRDSIYRAEHLVVCGGSATAELLGQELPTREFELLSHHFVEDALPGCGLWFETRPLAHLRRLDSTTVALEAADQEALERLKTKLRLEGSPDRRERRVRKSADGAPFVGPISMRSDIWALAGLSANEAVMAPSLSLEALKLLLEQRPAPEVWALERFEARE